MRVLPGIIGSAQHNRRPGNPNRIIRDFIQDVVEFLTHATVALGGPGSPYSGVRDDAGVLIEDVLTFGLMSTSRCDLQLPKKIRG